MSSPAWREGRSPQLDQKTVFKKKRRPAFSKNMVQFPYKSDGFEQKRVQQKSLSWKKIRTLARGGGARWGGEVGFPRVSAEKIFYLRPFMQGKWLKMDLGNKHNL